VTFDPDAPRRIADLEGKLRREHVEYLDRAYHPYPPGDTHMPQTHPGREPVMTETLNKAQEEKMTPARRVDPNSFTTVGGLTSYRGDTVSEVDSVDRLMRQGANKQQATGAIAQNHGLDSIYYNSTAGEVLDKKIARCKSELDRLEMLKVKFAAATHITKDEFLALFGPV